MAIENRSDLIDTLALIGLMGAARNGDLDALFGDVSDKAQIAALTNVTTADATDEASAITLANALKVKVNAIIAALKA
jgi:hypothetical protein